MIKKEISKANWIYNPLFGQNLMLPVTLDPFLQILYVHQKHWIAVASATPSIVYVYDRKYNSVERNTKMKIAETMNTAEKCIDFNIPKIQYKMGSFDCGLCY